jgi:uncharacterized protein YkwD
MKRLFLSAIFAIVAFTSNAQLDNAKLQQEFVKELNAYRISKGLNTVSLNSADIKTAQNQAIYCVSVNKLTHYYPDFKNVEAECALFNGNLPTAKTSLNQWINSINHNKLLLLPDVTTIGIYYIKGFSNEFNISGYYAVLVLNL